MTEDEQRALLCLAEDISALSTRLHKKLQESSQEELGATSASRQTVTNPETEALKNSLYEAAQDIQLLVTGPNSTLRALYGTHYDLAAHQVAFEFELFRKVPIQGSITTTELAEKTTLSSDIVARVLRLLATQKIFREGDEGVFTHTALSAAIAGDVDLQASFHMQMDEVFQAASDTACCLRKAPVNLDSTHCPFNTRHGSSIFQYYQENPDKGERFGRAMAGSTKCRLLSRLYKQYRLLNRGKQWIVV